MNEPYEPEVNDYVIWDKGKYGIDKGWVYFKGDPEVVKKGFRTKQYWLVVTRHWCSKFNQRTM